MDSLQIIGTESIHSIYENSLNILKFLLPSSDIHAKGLQGPEKGTLCLYMIVLCSPQTWDRWVRDLTTEVCAKQRLCNPKARLWKKLQIKSTLSTCMIFTLSSWFLYHTTWRRQICWEYASALYSLHWCTQVSIGPAGYYFRVNKNVGCFHLQFFENWILILDSLSLYASSCWKIGQVFRPLLLLWGFLVHNWRFNVSPVQVQNQGQKIDMNATSL